MTPSEILEDQPHEMDAKVREDSDRPERIQRFRVELSDALNELEDSKAMGNVACKMVSEFLNTSRATYALAFPAQQQLEVQEGWRDGKPGKAGVYSYREMGLVLLDKLSAGETVVVNDAATHPLIRDQFESAYKPLGIYAFVAVSLIRAQNLIAILSVHHATPRRWTDVETELLKDVARRVWDAIEKSRSEAQVRRVTARYRALAETAASVVFIVDPNGRLTETPVLRGVDESRFKGDKPTGWLEAIYPFDRSEALAGWNRALAEGQPFEANMRVRMDTGKYRWHSARAVPVKDEHGNIVEWVGTCVDVHERLVQQRTLSLLNEFASAIQGLSLPELIVTRAQDLLGDSLKASRVAYLESTDRSDRGLGGNCPWVSLDLDTEFSMTGDSSTLAQTLSQGKTLILDNIDEAHLPLETALQFRSLNVRAMICAPLLKDGKLVATLAVYQNEPRSWTADEVELVRIICERCWSETQRTKAQQDLRQSELELRTLISELDERVQERTAELVLANEEMEGFTYSVAHDLRAPLRAIVATSRILLLECDRLSSTERQLLDRQAYNANRLGHLIDELLRLSRINRQALTKTRFDLSALAEAVAEDVSKGLCEIEIAEGIHAVGDPLLIRFALLNLLENACKFSPNGGVVKVGETQINGKATYFVSDQGIGFDIQFIDKVFEPFHRLVQECDFPGTGIGLANVKRIVQRHGGKVWGESEPGAGSTFYFTLEP